MKKLRIAIVTNSHNPHPSPKGTIFAPGVIATQIADSLVEKGHKVDFYAPKESKTKARLIHFNLESVHSEFYKKYGFDSAYYAQQQAQIDLVNFVDAIKRLNKGEIDIIHSHHIRYSLPITKNAQGPIVHTLHTVIPNKNISDIEKFILKDTYKYNKFVAISERQQSLMDKKHFDIIETIPHGIDISQFPFKGKKSSSFLYVGRISPEKAPHIAIDACLKAKQPLILIGNVPQNKSAQTYWEKEIKPRIKGKITYKGHVRPSKVYKYYQKAKAVLFTSKIEESFGLTIIESLACGTPVIAFNTGIAKEAVLENKTGFIVKNQQQMIKALSKVDAIDRSECRKHVQEKFTVNSMADQYEKLFDRLLKEKKR